MGGKHCRGCIVFELSNFVKDYRPKKVENVAAIICAIWANSRFGGGEGEGKFPIISYKDLKGFADLEDLINHRNLKH